MAHFAQLDENNVVTQVIVVSNDDITDTNGVETESIGVDICRAPPELCRYQTSYNANMRVRYAGIGYSYNSGLDAFIPPQPYASWTLDNSSANWVAPITQPTLTSEEQAANKYYSWDESAYQADNTTGWVLQTPPSE